MLDRRSLLIAGASSLAGIMLPRVPGSNETVVVTERVEVPVEVEPTTPYCNIKQHGIWPKLLIASGALNLVLAAGWAWTARKKAIRQDNMPLVDYDIDDDDPA